MTVLNGRKARITIAVTLILALIGLSFLPGVQATPGHWRSINPTHYTSIPDERLNSVYILNGGTGGIGAGNGWAVGNGGIIFHWDGLAWNNQSSGTNCNLNSVNFGSPLSVPMNQISSSAGFIVGGCSLGQTALFWNGLSWFPVTMGLSAAAGSNLTSVFVTSVSGSSATAVAVGYNVSSNSGWSYFFNGIPGSGGGWTAVPIPFSTGLAVNSVYMVSLNEGWAVGFGGKIYHYSLGGWTNPYTFGGVDFYSVFLDSSSDGWAVGSGGQISRYTGGIWSAPITPLSTTSTLRSLSMVSSSEAWAVGDGATILHGTSLTGTPSWTAVASNLVPSLRGLRGVHATSGSNVWTVGESGSILMYDGSNWGSITAPLQISYNAVWMTSSNDGWAVGNTTTGLGGGSNLLHWDGVKWTRAVGVGFVDLYGVWEVNSGEAWAVGGGETFFPFILHYSGGAWSMVPTSGLCANCILRSVYGTGSSNVYAVGDGGLIAFWNGGSWAGSSTTQPTNGVTWRSITFVNGDPNQGWVVGFNQTLASPVIFQKTSIVNWAAVPVPVGVPASVRLNSVQFLDSSHGWIAGSGGTILFWDSSKWNIVPTPSSAYNLTSIFVTSTSDGWAVGQDGSGLPVFLQYNGISWTTVATTPPFPSTSPGTLRGLYLLSSTNGFAVGTQPNAASLGLMFHLDPPSGGPPPTTTTLVSTSTSIIASTVSTSTTAITTSTSISTFLSMTSTFLSVTSSTITSTTTVTSSVVGGGIPGFPVESIIAGVAIGIFTLMIIRRRRSYVHRGHRRSSS